MRTRCLSAFLICVQQLLLPYKIIRMFGPKTAILVPKYAFLGTYRPCRLIWCPVGWLVGGFGARAVSRKTPIYFIYTDMEFVQNFTPPDFLAKNFTLSFSPNFNSFSKKKHKK